MLKVTAAEWALLERVRSLPLNGDGLAEASLTEAERAAAVRLGLRGILLLVRRGGGRAYLRGPQYSEAVLDPGPALYHCVEDIPDDVQVLRIAGGRYDGRTMRVLSGYGERSVLGHLTATGMEVTVRATQLRPLAEGE